MRCKNCGFDSKSKYCPKCGKKKFKLSAITIISLISLIIALLLIGVPLLLIFIGAIFNSGNDAYGWAIFLLMILGFLYIPYQIIVCGITLLCDALIKSKTANIVRTIIIAILLAIPIIITLVFFVSAAIESNKNYHKNYSSIDYSIKLEI